MARPGPKRRMTDPMRRQLAELRDRGLSQAEIARAFGLSQQTISRELAKLERAGQAPGMGDPEDVVAFVNNHDNGLICLRAITQHYRKTMDQEWRERALKAYRAKFRMELVEWQ
jgi:transcriptional regulator with XRE-family HTH domain